MKIVLSWQIPERGLGTLRGPQITVRNASLGNYGALLENDQHCNSVPLMTLKETRLMVDLGLLEIFKKQKRYWSGQHNLKNLRVQAASQPRLVMTTLPSHSSSQKSQVYSCILSFLTPTANTIGLCPGLNLVLKPHEKVPCLLQHQHHCHRAFPHTVCYMKDEKSL